jgi:uncharacterized protein YjiS (DUF1127 family)
MTTTTTNIAPAAPAARGLRGFIAGIKTGMARHAVYRKTYKELADLTDRDLSDIGISRADISRIATEAAAH